MMKAIYITFRSVTYAQRGENILNKNTIACNLQRTPRWMEELGCGYCLRVRREDVHQAVALLKKHQISYRKIYALPAEGEPQELAL